MEQKRRLNAPADMKSEVGHFMKLAMEESAEEIGPDALERVLDLIGSGYLPTPESLIYLERRQPGAAEWVLARAQEIQAEYNAQEKGLLRPLRRGFQNLGSSVLRIVR